MDGYLVALPDYVRKTLESLRQTIKNAVPEAEDVISYQMQGSKVNLEREQLKSKRKK